MTAETSSFYRNDYNIAGSGTKAEMFDLQWREFDAFRSMVVFTADLGWVLLDKK